MKKTLCSFGICLLLVGAVPSSAQEWSASQQEIWKMEMAFWNSLTAGDLEKHNALWSDQAVAWPASVPAPIGKTAIAQSTGAWCAYIASYDLKPVAVGIYDNAALTFYQYEWIPKDNAPSDLRNRVGRMGHLWIKQSGSWQIVSGYTGGSSPYEQPEAILDSGHEWSIAQKEVWKFVIAFWDCLKDGNQNGAKELLHGDWLYWPYYSWEPIRKEQDQEHPAGSYDLKPQAIVILDNYAVIFYRFAVSSHTGRSGSILMKQEGKWQFIGGYTGGDSTSW